MVGFVIDACASRCYLYHDDSVALTLGFVVQTRLQGFDAHVGFLRSLHSFRNPTYKNTARLYRAGLIM